MFPQNSGGPQTGGQFTTSSILQQNNSLLGNPQGAQAVTSMPMFNPGLGNSTAPASSTTNPNVANMVAALKGATK